MTKCTTTSARASIYTSSPRTGCGRLNHIYEHCSPAGKFLRQGKEPADGDAEKAPPLPLAIIAVWSLRLRTLTTL